MTSWAIQVEEFEELQDIYEAGLEYPEDAEDEEEEKERELYDTLLDQVTIELDPRSKDYRPPAQKIDLEKAAHRKACVIGSHIFGSIKLGLSRISTGKFVRLFVNMDIPESYEVLGFAQASKLLQENYTLEYVESRSVFNTSYLLSFLMGLKNWQLYAGVLPKTVLRDLTGVSLAFCLCIYNLRKPRHKRKGSEERILEKEDPAVSQAVEFLTSPSKKEPEQTREEGKEEKQKDIFSQLELLKEMEEQLQRVLEIANEKFKSFGDLLTIKNKFIKKSFCHRAKIFGELFLKPYLESNCLKYLHPLDTVQLNQLECLDICSIPDLKNWQLSVKSVAEDTKLKPDDELVMRLMETVNKLVDNKNNLEKDIEQAAKEHKRYDIRGYRKVLKGLIKEFFDSLGTVKMMGKSGLVYSMNSLPALINYCQKLANSKTLKHEDVVAVINCRDRLVKIMDEGDALPLATLQQQIKTLWDEIINVREKDDAKQALIEVRNKFLESTSFEEAWSYALRMKGLIYEIIFAEDYNLNYVPEVNKLSLGAFIFKTYPQKYQDFLLRSSRNTYIRDIKPDFILHVHGALTPLGMPEWSQKFKRSGSFGSSSQIEVEDKPLITEEEKYSVERQKIRVADRLIRQLTAAIGEKRGECGEILSTHQEEEDEMKKSSKPNLVIIEVGYHTNSMDKVRSDINKWRPAKDILDSLGFDFRIISVADSTSGMNEKSWISDTKAKLLVKNMGGTFGKLTANMPPGITDISIGQISTQKLRSRISTDHIRKTPVTELDLLNFMRTWKESIFVRPSGAIIPLEIQKQFVRTLVLGSTMSKSTADKVLDIVHENKEMLIDKVRNSKLRFDIIDENSWIHYVYGCYEEDLSSYVDLKCDYLSENSSKTIEKFEVSYKYEINSDKKLERIRLLKDSLIETEKSIDRHCLAKHSCEIQNNKKSWLIDILIELSKQGSIEYGIKTVPDKSSIDWLCSLTLAGRTGKQKESKAQTIRLAETISRCTNGFLKDSKGLLLAPYKEIMKKSGIKSILTSGGTDHKEIEKQLGVKKAERKSKRAYLSPDAPSLNLFKQVCIQYDKIISKSDTLNNETIKCLTKLREDMLRTILTIIYENRLTREEKIEKDKKRETERKLKSEKEEKSTSSKFGKEETKKAIDIKEEKDEEDQDIDRKIKDEPKMEGEKLITNIKLSTKSMPEVEDLLLKHFTQDKETTVLDYCSMNQEDKKKFIEKKMKLQLKKPNEETIEYLEGFKIKMTCNEMLTKIGMSSYVEGENIMRSLFVLLKDTVNTDPASLVFGGHDKKIKKFRELKDDRYSLSSSEDVINHLNKLTALTTLSTSYETDDEIFNSVIIKVIERRYSNFPVGAKIFGDIRWFCKVIMGTNFGKSLYLYMKLCECFLNFTSEMTFSGVKLMKLKNCNLNLLCKVNKNKNTNCLCVILDHEFKPISNSFFLSRNRATLGQSFLYCMILNIYQAVQTQGGYEFMGCQSLVTSLSDLEKRMKEKTKDMIKLMSDITVNGIIQTIEKNKNDRALLTGSYSSSIGFNTVAAMIVNYSLVFMLSMLNNSRRISKLTQMVRYPLMLSISEFGFPKGIGGKMDCTIRSIEDYIMKKYLVYVCGLNISKNELIVNSWVENDPNNAKEIVSIELYPYSCKSPRQLVSDKYICHFYNKEDDDFSEASIRVLNEVCDKIFDWEEELKKECDNYYRIEKEVKEFKRMPKEQKKAQGSKIKKKPDKLDSLNSELKRCSCRIRSLMGVKDVEIKGRSKIDTNCLYFLEGEEEASEDSKSEDTRSESSYSLEKPMSLDEEDTISATGSTHLSERIPTSSRMDKINSNSIVYQMKKTCENMFKFTYGVPEISQAFAEKAKGQYSPFNIVNALKSKRNNEQISKITETTSIVSEPNTSFNIENAINTMSMKNAIKLVKIITKSNRATMSTSLKYRSFEREMSRILLMEDELRDKSMRNFKDNIDELKRKSRVDWKSICSMQIEEAIMTDNCSYLFVFIKSIWKKIRQITGKKRREMVKESDKLLSDLSKTVSENRVSLNIDQVYKSLQDNMTEIRKRTLHNLLNMIYDKQKLDKTQLQEKLHLLVMEFVRVEAYFTGLEEKRKKYPGAAYPEDEKELVELEEKIHINNNVALYVICLCLVTNESINPFTFSTGTYSTEFLKEFKKYALSLVEREAMDEHHREMNEIYLGQLLIFLNNTKHLEEFLQKEFELSDFRLDRLFNYCELLVLNIRRPISMKLMEVSKGLTNMTDIMETLKAMIARSSYKETQFDFSITVVSCVKGSLQMCRKLLDRREKSVKIPRGTRSKVIYEMIKATKTYNTTSVQEIGFQCALNNQNRFYAGVAPKAQIGGDRDLLVMSTEMKIATHCTEACSKAIMEASVDNDGLTNKNLKDQILEKAKENMTAKLTTDKIVVKSEKRSFVRIINISGDCGKWGPVHCCSYFSSSAQQTTAEFPDWSAFYRLVMLKSLNKQLEIPSAALEKLVQSALMSGEFRKSLRKLKIEGNKREKYEHFKTIINKEWSTNEKAKKIVNWYLKDDKAYIDSYNHMGQGIHHATSSMFGNICQRIIDDILEIYIQSRFPECSVKVTHAGSSDDFAKTIIISGMLTDEVYKHYDQIYKHVVCDVLNLMTGIMRCCQMLVSEKTVVGSISLEFYSEFLYVNKVSPSTKKYLTSQLINHSVTSPITLNQATHVECQQAMYMGVPLSSIVMLAILKQNLFYENSIDIYRRYGEIILNAVSTLGRMYLPKYSRLTSESASLEDLEVLLESLEYIIVNKKEIGLDKEGRFKIRRDSMSLKEKIVKYMPEYVEEEESVSTVSTESSLASSDRIMMGSVEETSSSEELIKRVSSSDVDEEEENVDISEIVQLDDNKVISYLLNLIMFKYYSSSDDYQTDEGFEKLQNWASSTLLKDPFAQMLPESIRTKIEQLKSIKTEMQDLKEILKGSGDPFKIIALNIIAKNTVTEDYDFEVGRLQQALESANIIWGLSGGIRSISVSVNRQMLRSYHFENRTPIEFEETWVKKDNSKFISGTGEEVKPSNRIRFSSFLDKFKECKINTKTMDIEILSVLDVPIEIISIDNEPTIYLDMQKLEDLRDLVYRIIIDLKDSNQINLESLEQCKIDEYERVIRPTIRRTRLVKAEKLNVFKNNPAIIAAAIIHQDSLYECRPTNLQYSYISSDIGSLETNFPNVVDMIRKIKDNQKRAMEESFDCAMSMTKSNVAKLITCCRMLNKQKSKYQKLFILTDLDEEANTTECKVLFCYNSIENMRVITSITSIHRIQDEITYTLLGVINCINWYFNNDDDKNSLLFKFLKSNIYRIIQPLDKMDCDFSKRATMFIDQLPNTSVEAFFSSECKYTRRMEKQKTLDCLSKICSNPSELHRATENYGYKTEIDYRGDIESGMFTFSSMEGTATGYVRNQIVFLMLSNSNPELLYSLENALLNQFRMKAGEIETYKAREQFFRLLPKFKNYEKSVSDNHFIYLDKDARFHIVRRKEDRPRNCKSEARICFISRGSLVVRYKNFINESRSIEQKWSNKYLYLISSVISKDVMPADSAFALLNSLHTHLGEEESERIKAKINDNVRRNIIHKINLQGSVNQHSVAIFHCLLKHSKESVQQFPIIKGLTKTLEEEPEMSVVLDEEELEKKLICGGTPGTDEFFSDKIMPILKDVGGLEIVWPINFLLDYYGYHHMTIDFEGITENSVNKFGHWNINKEQRLHVNQLQRVIESIIKLCEGNITRDTIFMSLDCKQTDESIKLVEQFTRFYKDFIINRDYLHICIYLLSVYLVRFLPKFVHTEYDKTSIFIKRMSESAPSLAFKCNKVLSIYISKKIESQLNSSTLKEEKLTRVSIDFQFDLNEFSVRPEEEKYKLVKAIKANLTCLKQINLKLRRSPEAVRAGVILFRYTIFEIVTTENLFMILEEINNSNPTYQQTENIYLLFYYLIRFCIYDKSKLKPSSFPKEIGTWLLAGESAYSKPKRASGDDVQKTLDLVSSYLEIEEESESQDSSTEIGSETTTVASDIDPLDDPDLLTNLNLEQYYN